MILTSSGKQRGIFPTNTLKHSSYCKTLLIGKGRRLSASMSRWISLWWRARGRGGLVGGWWGSESLSFSVCHKDPWTKANKGKQTKPSDSAKQSLLEDTQLLLMQNTLHTHTLQNSILLSLLIWLLYNQSCFESRESHMAVWQKQSESWNYTKHQVLTTTFNQLMNQFTIDFIDYWLRFSVSLATTTIATKASAHFNYTFNDF